MNLLKISLLALPLLYLSQGHAQNLDDPSILDQPGDTTFPLKDSSMRPDNFNEKEEQIEMQREEEVELDSFGEDEYNQNVDPDEFSIDDEFKNQ